MKKLKIIAVLMAILMTTNVHAALQLQSRPGVRAQTAGNYSTLGRIDVSGFFKLIREMEAEGGALGLNATFAQNSSTKEYEETSASNNIDAHMCKNTEWGTVAMLSASEYGAGVGKMTNEYDTSTYMYGESASTTGNMTGVFGMKSGSAEAEYVAGGIVSYMTSSYSLYLINAAPRYVDNYKVNDKTDNYSGYIAGDATYETLKFESGTAHFVRINGDVFKRGSGSIFSFDDSTGSPWSTDGNPGARLAVWVGEGL